MSVADYAIVLEVNCGGCVRKWVGFWVNDSAVLVARSVAKDPCERQACDIQS